MKSTLGYLGVATCLALLLGACGDDAEDLPPGNVSLSWLVGTSNCAAVGVETVTVLAESRSSITQDSFECDDERALLIGLEPETYRIDLGGEDSLGVERFGVSITGVEVRSGGTATIPTVRLLPIPALIEVGWYFDNGRMCTQNDVPSVDVIVWDGQVQEVFEQAPCSDAVRVVEVEQAGDYKIEVAGRDADGSVTHRGTTDVVVNYGDEVLVEVQLSPRDGGISTRE